MEDLNKTQLILLALLISFVSSIATGIVTVTLMQQAPQSVTQNINRVVEKTIEKVIPVTGPNLKEVKIIKEDDLIVTAIETAGHSLVRISAGLDTVTSFKGDFLGSGILLSEDGFVAVDSLSVSDPEQVYLAEMADGQIFTLSNVLDKRGFSIMKMVSRDKDKPVPKFTPVIFGDSDKVKVGQTAVSLGDSVAQGIVSGLVYEDVQTGTSTPPTKILSYIKTSTNPKDTSGSVVLSLEGNVIGLVGTRTGIKITVPANNIKDALTEAAKKK